MSTRRKGETQASFRHREAQRLRDMRMKRKLADESRETVELLDAGGHPVRIPVMDSLSQAKASEPIVNLYHRINIALADSRKSETTREVVMLCKAFQSMASGMRTLQAMATADEIRQIVELVDQHLPHEVRVSLQVLLDKIDARSGIRRAGLRNIEM